MKIYTHFLLHVLIILFFILIISYMHSVKYNYIHLPVFLLQLLYIPLHPAPLLTLCLFLIFFSLF